MVQSYPNSSSHDRLALLHVPLVVPIGFNARPDKMNRYRFEILPSFADQSSCLVTYVREQTRAIYDLTESEWGFPNQC